MINKNNTNIKRQRIWRLSNVEIAKKQKSKQKKKEKEMKRRKNKTTGQKGKLSSLFPYWAGKLLLLATKWQVLKIEAGAR